MNCLHPLELPIVVDGKKTNSYHLVPCGKCVACLRERQKEWIVRLEKELACSKECVFLTLTYQDDEVRYCYTDASGNYGFNYDFEKGLVYEASPTLWKEDVQKYFKRLRKRFDPGSIRFFLCGEYGSRTCRPHYHALIFYRGESSVDLGTLCQKDWHYGFTYVGTVNEASIAYVTKYTLKSLSYPEHSLKPFVLMSRRPAIGADYLQHEENVEFHLDHPYFVYPGGVKQKLPRYYADKIGVILSSVDDLLEKMFFKRHPEATFEEFYIWKSERVRNHEKIVAKRLREKDLL